MVNCKWLMVNGKKAFRIFYLLKFTHPEKHHLQLTINN